jgi:hypothetical protein
MIDRYANIGGWPRYDTVRYYSNVFSSDLERIESGCRGQGEGEDVGVGVRAQAEAK